MRKNALISIVLMITLLLSGCAMTPFATDASGDRYDTSFRDAHAFAEHWMGPCEETGVSEVNEIIVHEMRDEELGFAYTVYELNHSSVYGAYPTYDSEDFGYYYLKAFLERKDVAGILEKMDRGLSVSVNEPYVSKDTGLIVHYNPTVLIETDEKLTDEDAKEIVTEVREQLKSFDERGYFTRSVKTASANIDLRCAPWSSDMGGKFHQCHSIYDQDHP